MANYLSYLDLEKTCKSYLDLNFLALGEEIQLNHGYSLFSAISHLQPLAHGLQEIGIELVGTSCQKGFLDLKNGNSFLRIRLPVEKIPLFYSLAGKTLTVKGRKIRLGIPQIQPLVPAEKLYSRLVLIKGYQSPEPFLTAAQIQLEQLGIEANLSLEARQEGDYVRRTLQVKEYSLVGFGVKVKDLKEQDSILLQARGLGGKRRMGCGLFTSRQKV